MHSLLKNDHYVLSVMNSSIPIFFALVSDFVFSFLEIINEFTVAYEIKLG
tara:strand:+ start:435 stop:584 length:150 start_codon:yes stop_codon:yes gene_type:complete